MGRVQKGEHEGAQPLDHRSSSSSDIRNGRTRTYQSTSGPFQSHFDSAVTYQVQVDADGVVSFRYSSGEAEVVMGLTAEHVRAWVDRGGVEGSEGGAAMTATATTAGSAALELTREMARTARVSVINNRAFSQSDSARSGRARGCWTVDSQRHPEIKQFRETYMKIALHCSGAGEQQGGS